MLNQTHFVVSWTIWDQINVSKLEYTQPPENEIDSDEESKSNSSVLTKLDKRIRKVCKVLNNLTWIHEFQSLMSQQGGTLLT